MAINPDVLYLPSREDLLPYEDSRFNALASGIPNYYAPVTDNTIYGSILRALAMELARLEYNYSYDVVTYDPKYLTPPDIKRRFAGPLFINKSYPNPTQSDQGYKAMMVGLLNAYKQGCTVQAIVDVIEAYTGLVIPVVELYTEIGNGIYNETDRNTISVSVPIDQVNPLTQLTSSAWVQTISQDLYNAIALATPAHVGISYAVVFGSEESFRSRILGITDVFSPVLTEIEAAPLPLVFTQAPMMDPDSPDTQLSAYGKLAGTYLTENITAQAWAALQSTDFQAEYLENQDGSYSLNPAAYNDVLLVDVNGNTTGAVSRAQGVLAPQLVKSWEIKSDAFEIFELD